MKLEVQFTHIKVSRYRLHNLLLSTLLIKLLKKQETIKLSEYLKNLIEVKYKANINSETLE